MIRKLLLLVFVASSVIAQNQLSIPDNVAESFHKVLPDGEILNSEYSAKKNCYRISTIYDGKLIELDITQVGEILLRKEEIPVDKLGKKITRKIKSLFEDGEVIQVFQLSGKKEGYEVTVYDNDSEYRLIFSRDGLLKKKVHVEEETDFGC